MYHYRQALVRMRLGDSDRQIAKSGLMGRRVAATVRGEAAARGWLDTDQPLPPDETLASIFDAPKKQRARQSSSLEPHRDQKHNGVRSCNPAFLKNLDQSCISIPQLPNTLDLKLIK
ncbi:MAG: hypothetical protein GY792_11490 [Gammaproteobacteria bacterium]|nr:hypothetical protein [Gammaproteobacteria bacterium]